MKVILIEEERFAEILQIMEMAAKSTSHTIAALSEQQMKFASDAIFRSINYEFVRWAQSHGASCVKK